jgi:deazaflavin-dependent oxidoreductase (nitroreductase family)
MDEGSIAERLARVASRQTLTLTHYGRKSGKAYEVTIWFMVDGERVFLPTANVNRSWVKNTRKHPGVKLKIDSENFDGEASFLAAAAQREHAMELVRSKYWWALPMIAFARILSAIGLATDTSGAFEVTIQPAQA